MNIHSELLQIPLPEMLTQASLLRDEGHRNVITYSRKVFIPLTQLCRDVCHYCTFAQAPRYLPEPYLNPEQVLAIAGQGKALGCKEALFTLGDKPELRYRAARDALKALGYSSTLEYLHAMAQRVLEETGLLPHLNPGVLTQGELQSLKTVAPSMGLMLENISPRLSERGGPHFGSPDKDPEVRLASIRAAGLARVPLTSGILIGIGETRQERLDSLVVLKELHDQYGHLQEIIVQNFMPKAGTKMHDVSPPSFDELLWTTAAARILFGPDMSIQVPPNLNPGKLQQLIAAGINDWGGVSPLTPDHVNPESPWPHLDDLAAETKAAGKHLTERLTVYPQYIQNRYDWIDPGLHRHVLELSDGEGLAREQGRWAAGRAGQQASPVLSSHLIARSPHAVGGATLSCDKQSKWTPDQVRGDSSPVFPGLTRNPFLFDKRPDVPLAGMLSKASEGEALSEQEIVRLFQARGDDFHHVCAAADQLRQQVCGDTVSYVVNRNINYTNICNYKCTFCAFAKGKTSEDLRGQPYLLDLDEISRRVEEAWQRGATEVCLQGGIHPKFTGQTYLDICNAVREAAPDIHIHAFTPLEVTQGATTLGLSVAGFLTRLQKAGLNSLPGTAAEILEDDIRAVLCPDKITARQWLDVMETAHGIRLSSTATIMFGHMESYADWALHLSKVRALQKRSGGFTEFVPLPFVHMEAPLYLRGGARPGPTRREAVLMHAVSRLVFHTAIDNIQVSWPKLGPEFAAQILSAGANDLGGTLMNESISKAAGGGYGQELSLQQIEEIIRSVGRVPRQRNTSYGEAGVTAGASAHLPPLPCKTLTSIGSAA